jgi:hypothetical protein
MTFRASPQANFFRLAVASEEPPFPKEGEFIDRAYQGQGQGQGQGRPRLIPVIVNNLEVRSKSTLISLGAAFEIVCHRTAKQLWEEFVRQITDQA